MAQPKATTPEAVLEAAAIVFAEKGYHLATLEDIATQAKISKPTVYRYAKSKQWLMDRIVKRVQSELSDRGSITWEDGLPAMERLRRHVRVNAEVAAEYAVFYNVVFYQYRESSPRAAREFRAWARGVTERTADLLEECVEQGVLTLPGSVTIYANLLQGMLASLNRWFRGDRGFTPDDVTEYVMQLLCSGNAAQLEPRVPS